LRSVHFTHDAIAGNSPCPDDLGYSPELLVSYRQLSVWNPWSIRRLQVELFSEDAAQQRDALVCCTALTDNKRLQ
jgi:hypothetical protein